MAPKVRQLEKNGYIDLTQPHVDRLRSNFTKWYCLAPGQLRNCENLLWVEFKMADDAQITGWVVAITCYISHSAKYRKTAKNLPWSRNPWTDFNETWNIWLHPGSTSHDDKLAGVALRGWSGQIGDLSHLWVSFLFLLFLLRFCWPISTIYIPKMGILSPNPQN